MSLGNSSIKSKLVAGLQRIAGRAGDPAARTDNMARKIAAAKELLGMQMNLGLRTAKPPPYKADSDPFVLGYIMGFCHALFYERDVGTATAMTALTFLQLYGDSPGEQLWRQSLTHLRDGEQSPFGKGLKIAAHDVSKYLSPEDYTPTLLARHFLERRS